MAQQHADRGDAVLSRVLTGKGFHEGKEQDARDKREKGEKELAEAVHGCSGSQRVRVTSEPCGVARLESDT